MDSPCTYCDKKDKCKELCPKMIAFFQMLDGSAPTFYKKVIFY